MNPAERDVILAELAPLREGGPTKSTCTRCRSGISRHRCLDCFCAECLYATCLVKQHAEHPLHRIETWIGGRWARPLATAQVDPGSAVAFNLMDAAQKEAQDICQPTTPVAAESMANTPIGAKSADRVRAALEGGTAAVEELWTSAMRELEDWAYRCPPPLEEPKPESVYTPVDQIE
ncbi:hypothetical protein DFH09DRAFT_1318295 [Mycena vulgaris]|nr:hypothetical protein DFH09DRAFT_1318295 [Mycena vulgaris]